MPVVGYVYDETDHSSRILWGQGETDYAKWQGVSAKGHLRILRGEAYAEHDEELTKDSEIVLSVHVKDAAGKEAELELDFTTRLANLNGVLIAKGIPRMVAVPQDALNGVFTKSDNTWKSFQTQK